MAKEDASMTKNVFTNSDGTGQWDDYENWSYGVPNTLNSFSDAVASNVNITIGGLFVTSTGPGSGAVDTATSLAFSSDLPLGNQAYIADDTIARGGYPVPHYLDISGSLALQDTSIMGPGVLQVGGLTTLDGTSAIQVSEFDAQSIAGSGTIAVGKLSLANASSNTTVKLEQSTTITAAEGSFDGILVASSSDQTITLPKLSYQAGETIQVKPTAAGASTFSVALLSPDGDFIYTLAQVEEVSQVTLTATAFAGATGTIIEIACYCSGTNIHTSEGERSVETLAIGDTVITASGQHRSIRWIGRRSYAGRFLAANRGVQPVRFSAGSLGEGLPHRDLLVSAEHAMFLDGLLIPARCLVNGSTIVQERGLARVDYFHIELDSHDVLLAEGAASESYLDDDSRGMFHNASEYAVLYPGMPTLGGFCAPKVEEGYQLEAIRRRLAALAGEIAAAA